MTVSVTTGTDLSLTPVELVRPQEHPVSVTTGTDLSLTPEPAAPAACRPLVSVTTGTDLSLTLAEVYARMLEAQSFSYHRNRSIIDTRPCAL